jgi:hypothetical protein
MAKLISILLIIAFSVFQVNGCSVIGLGIGSLIDHHNAHKVIRIPNSEMEEIKRGSHIILKLNDGEVINGTYCGCDNDSLPSAIYLGRPGIGLKNVVDTTRIEMNRISEIRGTVKTNSKLTGLLIGALFDLVAIVGLLFVAGSSVGSMD